MLAGGDTEAITFDGAETGAMLAVVFAAEAIAGKLVGGKTTGKGGGSGTDVDGVFLRGVIFDASAVVEIVAAVGTGETGAVLKTELWVESNQGFGCEGDNHGVPVPDSWCFTCNGWYGLNIGDGETFWVKSRCVPLGRDAGSIGDTDGTVRVVGTSDLVLAFFPRADDFLFAALSLDALSVDRCTIESRMNKYHMIQLCNK